ncbi:unnamed protein product [Lupinus luteus]|uniref:Uncharacterized protein n=1 Tax=Lupinus luteus TaxID=3873 RepID=A0AAV1VRB9_LUPLU
MEHIGPDPIIPSLLTLQDEHVLNNIWIGGEVTFRARYNFWQRLPSERVLQVIRNTTFGYILDIGASEINNHLITALIERQTAIRLPDLPQAKRQANTEYGPGRPSDTVKAAPTILLVG